MTSQRSAAGAVIALLLFSLLSLCMTNKASAEPAGDFLSPRELGWISVELDPLTTPIGARNLFLYLEPPALEHWSMSIGAFASDFPDAIDNILSYRNRDADFDIRVRLSPGLTVDYFLSGERSKWHVGVMMFLWRYEVERNGSQATFTNHVVLPRVGYRWFPWESINVYLDPFAGLMTEYTVSGETTVDGETVKSTPLIPFASAHLGFHF